MQGLAIIAAGTCDVGGAAHNFYFRDLSFMDDLKQTPAAGDVFTWYNEPLKVFTACQVIKVENQNQAHLLFLNWFGEEPLDVEGLFQIRPLHLDAFFQEEKDCVYFVKPVIPIGFSFVANIAPLTHDLPKYWSYWEDLGWELPYQLKWEKIPLEKRNSFKSSKDDTTLIEFNGSKVSRNIKKIDDGNLNFHNVMELEVFPCVSDLNLRHYHPGLKDYLEANPFVTNLTLENPEDCELDFNDTFIKKLIINLKNVNLLRINDDLETLQCINEEAENCYISSRDNGNSLHIASPAFL